MKWCTGMSSTAVTPSCCRYSSELGMRKAGIRPAQFLRDVRMTHREALDMQLVDDGVGPRGVRVGGRHPTGSSCRRRHSSAWPSSNRCRWRRDRRRRTSSRRAPGPAGTDPRSPARRGRAAAFADCDEDRAAGRTGPWTRSPYRCPGPTWSMYPCQTRSVRSCELVDGGLDAVVVEQHDVHAICRCRVHGEVRSLPVPRRTERRLAPGPRLRDEECDRASRAPSQRWSLRRNDGAAHEN